jgi:hypothetical protein
MKKIPML